MALIETSHLQPNFQDNHFLHPFFQVRFVFDNGPGKVPVEYTPANSSELCDYRWHTLLAEKDGTTGSLTVDHTHTVSQTPADPLLQRFLTVNTNDPLYIGGLPGTHTHTLLS